VLRRTRSAATDLLLMDLESVAVLHVELWARVRCGSKDGGGDIKATTHSLWVIGGVDSLTIEEESHAGGSLALTVAEGIHELLELGGALDLEVDLVVVIGDLDVKVLAALGLLRWRSSVGHCVCSVYGAASQMAVFERLIVDDARCWRDGRSYRVLLKKWFFTADATHVVARVENAGYGRAESVISCGRKRRRLVAGEIP